MKKQQIWLMEGSRLLVGLCPSFTVITTVNARFFHHCHLNIPMESEQVVGLLTTPAYVGDLSVDVHPGSKSPYFP
jgi:hypothetical protein